MPTTVSNLFSHFDLPINGHVKWKEEVISTKHGIYIVALTNNAEKLISLETPIFNNTSIRHWIDLINKGGKTILVDGKPASIESIKQRLSKFWLPDETILYIGKAGPTKNRTLRKRLNEFYTTILGCNKKHAGGHWLNTLDNIGELNIFYSETNPAIEIEMIKYFCANVSDNTKETLFDSINCLPFANKEINKSIRKVHGFSNQTIYCK